MSTREDLTEEAEQSLDAAVPVTTDRPSKPKPARIKNPKPTVSYIAVRRGWDPRDRHDRLSLWNPQPSRGAAEADRAHADWLGCEPRVIVQVDTTFTIVDEGGFGEA